MLSGKHILVTGASSGIGAQCARRIAECGAQLTITGRNTQRLEETLLSLAEEGHHRSIPCDITDEQSCDTMVSALEPLDGALFAAGINEFIPLKFAKEDKVEKLFRTNCFANISLTQKMVKKRLFKEGASLVFISSLSSMMGVPGTLIYSSSKAALNAAVRVMASELAPLKIRVNTISPGIVRSNMLSSTNIEEEQFIELEKEYPLGLGSADDVAGAVIFHLSNLSRWLTGQNMILDGGHSLK